MKDANLEVWTALLGPAKLSTAARTRITEAMAQVMKMPEVRQGLFDRGWQPVGTSPRHAPARAGQTYHDRIIQSRGIKITVIDAPFGRLACGVLLGHARRRQSRFVEVTRKFRLPSLANQGGAVPSLRFS